MHHKRTVSDWRVDISKQVRKRLEFVSVIGDTHISDLKRTKLVLVLDRLGFFVVAKQLLESEPEITGRGFGFEDCVKQLLRHGAVNPHFYKPVTFFPLRRITRRRGRGAIKVSGDTKADAVSFKNLTSYIIIQLLEI